MRTDAPNKFLQSDQIALSCLLQRAQKPRQHALAAEERRDADGHFIPSVPVYVSAISHGKNRDHDPGVGYGDASMDYWEARLPGEFEVEAGWLCRSDARQAVRDSVTIEVAGSD